MKQGRAEVVTEVVRRLDWQGSEKVDRSRMCRKAGFWGGRAGVALRAAAEQN